MQRVHGGVVPSRGWSVLATAVALGACAPVPLPHVERAPLESAPAREVYRLAWVSAEGLGERVAVAPWGDVLVYGDRQVHLLARHDGSVLDSASVQYWVRGMDFVDDRTLVVVTMEGHVTEMRFPGLATRAATRVEGRAACAAVRRGRVAIGTDDGRLIVMATPAYELMLEVRLAGDPRRVKDVALSDDGSLVAASHHGRTSVYDVASQELVVSSKEDMGALSIAPDNRTLFGGGWNHATLLSLTTGKTLRAFEGARTLSATAFLSAQLMVGVGFLGGMQLFQPGRGEPEHLPAMLGDRDTSPTRSVSVSPAQHMLCGGGVDGHVVCFSTRRLEPSQYRKPTSLVGEPWD